VVIVSIFALVKFFGDWTQPAVWGTVTDVAGKNAASVFGAVNTVGSIAAFLAGPLMGLMIMSFSVTVPIENWTGPADVEEPAEEVTEAKNETRYELGKKNLNKGTFNGSLVIGDRTMATFEDPEKADFSFVPFENSSAETAKFDKRRGVLSVRWQGKPPANTQVVVDYQFTDFSNGWTALFLALGAIYLACSISWLFIDCTKTIEDEPDEKS